MNQSPALSCFNSSIVKLEAFIIHPVREDLGDICRPGQCVIMHQEGDTIQADTHIGFKTQSLILCGQLAGGQACFPALSMDAPLWATSAGRVGKSP